MSRGQDYRMYLPLSLETDMKITHFFPLLLKTVEQYQMKWKTVVNFTPGGVFNPANEW